jgi:hypothetical protein
MKTFKIHPDLYPAFQRSVDAAFKDTLIKEGKCQHIFPPEMEADEDGYITLRVKQWIFDLEGMAELLGDLEEVETPQPEN